MTNLRSFHAMLQEEIRFDDKTWAYNVPNLPEPKRTDAAKLVKSISVVSSFSKQHIQLRLENAPSNRVTRADPLHLFLLLSFNDFRLRQTIETPGQKPYLATARDSAEYIARLLKTGIVLNGIQYNFFGHSNSQLKSRSCFMFAATRQEISAKVEAMGDFSKLKSVGKKAKRIGLLFSSAEMAVTLDPSRCEDIDDIKYNDYIFTDGCGLISVQLARQLVQRRNIAYRNKRYLPSVFQIRYRGYKGVLTLCPALKGKIQVQFRDSMRKFKDAKDLSLSVVEYSKPYNFGFLNDEIVLLIHSLGIADEALLRKQTEYLQFLQNVTRGDNHAAFQFLSFINQLDLAEKLLMNGMDSVLPKLRGLVKEEYARMLNKHDEQRCRILIPKSRLLFGICDPFSKSGVSGKLKPGTCFVRITLDGNGEARTLINTEVLVTRNPCLHPGDIQKFRVVDVPDFAHLVDCIVFPTSGKRPSADLMSGGDLDGDKFFVTWDPEIIPRVVSEPAAYPGVKEPITFHQVTDDDRVDFFARYTNASLGRVKNLYLKWARYKGSQSSECQQLNRLFSQCVDGNRIKVPPHLEDPPEPDETSQPFILDVLHSTSKEAIEKANDRDTNYVDYPIDIMDLLLSRDKLAISEFELLQLTLGWCDRNGADIIEFAEFFDFSALTDEQQIWLLNRLPPLKDTPSLIRNGLLLSQLVERTELQQFKLDHPGLHWKPVFNSKVDRMDRFLNCASRSLELFNKKLIILQADERLTLAIYLPQKIAKASEVQVDATVRVFALPRSQGGDSVSYRVMPTKVNYRLYCDDHTFQLYELKRGNTFVFLTRGPSDQSSFRDTKNKGDRRRQKQVTIDDGINFDCRASVALNKIDKRIQSHVGRMYRAGVLAAEIYVISNRDVKSMQLLDQWLHYIDTEEVLPLFEKTEREYSVPSLKDVDWAEVTPAVTEVVRDKNLSRLRVITSLNEINNILQLLTKNDEKVQLRAVYGQLLDIEASSSSSPNRTSLARHLLQFLQEAVYLIPLFFQSQTWKFHKQSLKDDLIHIAPTLLKELILCANSYHGFVRQLFTTLLQELNQISMQHLAELVELIALSVQEPETAMDLLLECIEPETSRLLVGRLPVIDQFTKCLIGISLDHIDEAAGNKKSAGASLELVPDGFSDGFEVVKTFLRIDSPGGTPRVGDHIRLRATNPPGNAPLLRPYSMDAIVLKSELGSATLRCMHRLPPYVKECVWNIINCGSFVTSKAMFDAITALYTQKVSCCRLYASFVGLADEHITLPDAKLRFTQSKILNVSQNRALEAAMKHNLVFLWGPPGTGKTQTIVAILEQLLNALSEMRFLVTAPTHNAVDNILQRFIQEGSSQKTGVKPLRVSTNPLRIASRWSLKEVLTESKLSKVSSALREFTCDAMVGKDISDNFAGRRQAQDRIKGSRLIFTTCVGAGLGLLRSESFDVVLIDEASQQAEPESLIPLTKGCHRAILVGDHVQLRATVQKHAVVAGFDISLFERHYNMPTMPGVAKVMLDTQYRMHSDISSFSSAEFYDGKLKTAANMDKARIIAPSKFPWPANARKVFIQCTSPEDLGNQSKANLGQIDVCRRVCKLLQSPVESNISSSSQSGEINPSATGSSPMDIALLTPYTRQKELLESAIPSLNVSSIDGYQGREADVIIFVTVRSNVHCETGFLKDMRRLNVAMTRARAGVIIIGNRTTLTGRGSDGGDAESEGVWKRLLDGCTEVNLPG